ncbi:unnamed protein product, partial [Owenia fusiformis]
MKQGQKSDFDLLNKQIKDLETKVSQLQTVCSPVLIAQQLHTIVPAADRLDSNNPLIDKQGDQPTSNPENPNTTVVDKQRDKTADDCGNQNINTGTNKQHQSLTELPLPSIGRGRGRGRNASAPEGRNPGISHQKSGMTKSTKHAELRPDKRRDQDKRRIEVVIGTNPNKEDEPSQLWTDVVRRKRPPTNNNTKSSDKDIPVPKRSSRSLRGVQREKGITLYVENIEKDDSDSDDDIKQQVIQQAKHHNIRIMQCYVIHNRVSQYSVGYKIVVPLSCGQRAQLQSTWPAPIKCREWVSKRKWDNAPFIDSEFDQDDIYRSTKEYDSVNSERRYYA